MKIAKQDCLKFDIFNSRIACTLCGMLFSKWAMYKHKRTTHLNISYFECDICKKSFEDQQLYEKHRQTHGKSEEIVQVDRRKEIIPCPDCGKKISRWCMSRHKRR